MRIYEKKPMSERLNKYYVDPQSGCWVWYGSVDKDGYGRLRGSTNGVIEVIRAPRASYELHVGPIPEGLMVLHRCNNPPCINPEHLYAGDSKDNGADMVAAGNAGKSRSTGSSNGMYGRIGELNPFYGKKHTDEVKAKMAKTYNEKRNLDPLNNDLT